VSDFTGLPALTITAITVVGDDSWLHIDALGGGRRLFSDELWRGRLDIPICAVPSMIAAIPVVEPSAADVEGFVPGCCAFKCSARLRDQFFAPEGIGTFNDEAVRVRRKPISEGRMIIKLK